VHRHARAALARRLARGRRGTAPRPGHRRHTTRARTRLRNPGPGLEALAQLRRAAHLGRPLHPTTLERPRVDHAMKLPTHLHRTDIDTPLGPMCLAATPEALVGAWFHDQRHAPDPTLMARWTPADDHAVLRAAAAQLADYFAARRPGF